MSKKHETALKEILKVWKSPDCLHTCRWGKETIELCTKALEKPKKASKKKGMKK